MPLLHVHKLNRERVRRGCEFRRRQHQWRMVLLAPPPLDDVCNLAQGSERRIAQHAEQIQIRIFGMKFALRPRAVEKHAHQVRSRSSSDLFNKFADQFFVGHCFSLPAATGAAAAKTATATAAKTTKTAAAAETTATTKPSATTAATEIAEYQHPEQGPPQR